MKLAATIPTCVDYEMELQLCLRGSPTHRCANGNEGSTTTKKHAQPKHQTPLENLIQMNTETAPLGPKESLLHKATLPKLGDVADTPNTQK